MQNLVTRITVPAHNRAIVIDGIVNTKKGGIDDGVVVVVLTAVVPRSRGTTHTAHHRGRAHERCGVGAHIEQATHPQDQRPEPFVPAERDVHIHLGGTHRRGVVPKQR